MLEFYTQTRFAPPDWGARDRMQTHLAFLTGDLDADRDRLVAAGAAVEGDPVTHPNGDRLLFMRDPWGLAFQLVRRAAPLLDT
jgi:predicted enzyme related to lactoylglutathione lyase